MANQNQPPWVACACCFGIRNLEIGKAGRVSRWIGRRSDEAVAHCAAEQGASQDAATALRMPHDEHPPSAPREGLRQSSRAMLVAAETM
jgi:hypothetical protein